MTKATANPPHDSSAPSSFASRRAAREAREALNGVEPRRQFGLRAGIDAESIDAMEIRHVEA